MCFMTGTNIRKCLVWSLNATTFEHVHGSVLINHLLSCSSQIKISPLWVPILKYIVLISSLPRIWSVELCYALYNVIQYDYMYSYIIII
jgi:hypothetical protein